MPYQGEYANKVAHTDIIRNPQVAEFLKQCEYLTTPSDEEGHKMSARYQLPPSLGNTRLPQFVMAIDGSRYETSIDERLPSTKIGFVKVGAVLIDMHEYGSLRVEQGRFVDPFRVAALQNGNTSLVFSLPSANIRWRGSNSVRDGFRAAVDAALYGQDTRFNDKDPKTSLRSTLFHLASRRPGKMGTGDSSRLKIHRCPACDEEGPFEVHDSDVPGKCPHCNAPLYPSDCLRLWEEVTDHQSNMAAISRFMLVVEHLLCIHYIRHIFENARSALGSMAFFIDGPLAIFGTSAWLHGSIMRYVSAVNDGLGKIGQSGVLIIGLQKAGQVVDHVALVSKFLENDRLLAVSDDYRYQFIVSDRDPAKNGFGSETYYGQDFIYKTPSGRTFVLGLPYPFDSKDDPNFVNHKIEWRRYAELPRCVNLVKHFESDLYENAVVPIALAHRYTAISLTPGGRVLDLLARKTLRQGNS